MLFMFPLTTLVCLELKESRVVLQTIENSREKIVLTTVQLTAISLKGTAETTQLQAPKMSLKSKQKDT